MGVTAYLFDPSPPTSCDLVSQCNQTYEHFMFSSMLDAGVCLWFSFNRLCLSQARSQQA